MCDCVTVCVCVCVCALSVSVPLLAPSLNTHLILSHRFDTVSFSLCV